MKKCSKRGIVLGALLTLLAAPQAFADEAMPIDLQTAISKAFATHADITMAAYDLEQAEASLNAAKQSFGPTISLTHNSGRGGYYHDYQNQGKLLGNRHSNTATLSLPIYSGGKLEGAVDKANANYKSYLLGYEKAYIDLQKTTTDAYYTLLQAKNSLDVSHQSVSTLEDHLKNVQAQYDVGVVAKVDLLRSEVELTDAQQTLTKAQNSYDIAEATLDNIMGIPQDTKLAPQETLQYKPFEKDLDFCIDYALENRIDLMQSKLAVDAADADLNVAKAGWRPTVEASGSSGWGGNNSNWPGDDDGNWSVGVSVNFTPFDNGVTVSKVHAAKAELLAQKEQHRKNIDTVRLDVRSCYYDLREAEKRISTTAVAVEKADEDYRIAQLRYQAGVGTNTDVLDAQVALTTARNNYNTALYDYNTSKAALDTAMGVEARPQVYGTQAKPVREDTRLKIRDRREQELAEAKQVKETVKKTLAREKAERLAAKAEKK